MLWDYNKVIVVPQRENLPLKWESVRFRRSIVEIGFGNGEHLEYLALRHPEDLVVGIEVSQWCIEKAARRALRGNITNLRLIHGDARYILDRCFPLESIDRIIMNFPCPWPKKKHAHHRVAGSHFIEIIARMLRPPGVFELATDVDWYAFDAMRGFSEKGCFTVSEVNVNPAREYITKYERKWRRMGKRIYSVTAEKRDGVLTFKPCEEALWEMSGESAAAEAIGMVIERIKDKECRGPNYRAFFRDVFVGEDGTALIRAISIDDGFEQHFFIRIMPTSRGVQAKVDSVGLPYRTPGVRACLTEILGQLKAAEKKLPVQSQQPVNQKD